jgi:ADP-ribosylglycohydrolase
MARARLALDGTRVGDCFGECFFGYLDEALLRIAERRAPQGPWMFTDDTAMAISVTAVLQQAGGIDGDLLAAHFAASYRAQPGRGYGRGAHGLLAELGRGGDWRVLAPALFDGGSWGNGGAMRVTPVGGYFAGELEAAAEHGRRSAAVTHAHPEGQAGAAAVAVAAAHIAGEGASAAPDIFRVVLDNLEEGEVRDGVARARDLAEGTSPQQAAAQLGAGENVSAQDTVPFVLWCASRGLADFEAAMWRTVAGLGDRDTTCAMVGGLCALAVGRDGLPAHFLERCEALPAV